MGNTFTDASAAVYNVIGLCTREQVKAALGIPLATTNKDAAIDEKIACVVPAFNRWCVREFMPHVTETRTFDIRTRFVAIGDLRAATTVTLNDTNALADDVGYRLSFNGMSGTATHLSIAPDVSLSCETSERFGVARLSIRGDWGIWGDVSEVPADVNEAAIQTVAARMDRGASNVSGIDVGDPRGTAPTPESAWFIPTSARLALKPWAMNVIGVW